MRTYDELITFSTFIDRYKYLRLLGDVGVETFGFNRYLNQAVYSSTEWRHTRNKVIYRDQGCDLGIEDRPIYDKIYIHHINPLTEQMILDNSSLIYSLNNLICVSFNTHNAIHFGDESLLIKDYIPRVQNDTKLW